MYSKLLLSLPAILTIGLAACSDPWSPSPWPSGYSYHHNQYKSAPGPEAPELGYDYSETKNAQIVHDLRNVAEDLLDNLEVKFEIPDAPIYVETLPETEAFTQSFDYVIREDLTRRGYTVVSNPHVNALTLSVNAERPKNLSMPEPLQKGYEVLALSLTMTKDVQMIGQVSGLYPVPAYGHDPYRDTTAHHQ